MCEGRNRQIREMCRRAGLTVHRLVRTHIDELSIKGLQPGEWRPLPPAEAARELAAKVAKFIGYKAPIALKIANEIIDRQAAMSMEDAIEVELSRCKEIFATDDALLGLSNIGKRVEYKGS